MRVLFCETTRDITYLVSDDDIKEFTPTEEAFPSLSVRVKGFDFYLGHLMFSTKTYMKITEPKQDHDVFWTNLSNDAFKDLIANKKCGTRYAGASKITVIIDNEL